MLLAQGVDGRVVMALLGWSQASLLTRYQHVLEPMRRDARHPHRPGLLARSGVAVRTPTTRVAKVLSCADRSTRELRVFASDCDHLTLVSVARGAARNCTQVRPTFSTRSVSVSTSRTVPVACPARHRQRRARGAPTRSGARWMLAGWTPIRSAARSAVRPRSESAQDLSPQRRCRWSRSRASTSFGMSTGIDRRGIGRDVPDGTAVALSARECKYRGLKDADRTDQGRHPVGARAPHPRRGVSAACPVLSPWPLAVAQPIQGRSSSPAEPVRASHAVIS